MSPTTEERPRFRATLEPAAGNSGTTFLSGPLDAYGLDSLAETAAYGVGAIRIDVDGIGPEAAGETVRRHLRRVLRRGVSVQVTPA